MFAWIGWNICYCIYSMLMRVFWLLVDDYWLSWWKDLISNFPLTSFSIFLLVGLPVLIHQLQNSIIPPSSSSLHQLQNSIVPPSSSSLPSIELIGNQLPTTPPNTPSTPNPIPITNIAPINTIERNLAGDSNNMSTRVVRNITVIGDHITVTRDMNEDNSVIKKAMAPKPKSSIMVIDKQFCSSSKIELTITGKEEKSIFDNFSVKDGNGKIIFRIEEGESCFHVRRILVNAAGRPILSMEKKIRSTHNRWQAFKGDSRYIEDLLFTAKQTSVVQIRTKLEVFLASNASEAICDFLVQGRWSEQSCQIYGAGRSGILAQMNRDLAPSVGNGTYMVTVYPNIDYAFIVTLIFILDSINNVLRLKD